jgi:hypothetical protein
MLSAVLSLSNASLLLGFLQSAALWAAANVVAISIMAGPVCSVSCLCSASLCFFLSFSFSFHMVYAFSCLL